MRIGLDFVVQRQDVQRIQMLTFILVQTFDLYVKQGVRVDDLTSVFLDVLGKAALVFQLDLCQLLQHLLVILVGEQLF